MTDMTASAADGDLPLDETRDPHSARSINVGRTRDDDDRLPWLEPAVAQESDTVPAGKLAALVVAALVVLAIVVGGVFVLRQQTGVAAKDPTLIAADTGDYKVRPDAPGGMKVEGRGDSAFATSEGAEADGRVDLNALPETPVAATKPTTKPGAAAKAATTATVGVPGAGATLVAAAPATAGGGAPAPSAAGRAVQLGSFPSEAAANASWTRLAKRFAYLTPLGHGVQAAEVNGATVYRLRADAGDDAGTVCGKLRVAGEACFIVR